MRGFHPYGCAQNQWEKIYTEKAPNAVRWFRSHLETSLELIGRLAPDRQVPIIDVGGGESTLVDDFLARGYQNITVLDISPTAIDANKKRLGKASELSTGLPPTLRRLSLNPPPTICGTTGLSFTSSPRQPIVSPRFAKQPAPFGAEGTLL